MEYVMKLNESSFERVKKGIKIREYRLYDEKRKQVRVGDTIKFLKLPNLDESILVDVNKIEVFNNWTDCYEKYFIEDFKDRYKDVEEVLNDTYQNYYTKEESLKYQSVVFTIKKHRVSHLNAVVCYLKKDDKVLMIKFAKKWGNVYAPPGGKFEKGESPLDCILREFKEETGLTLIKPKLQGMSYWQDEYEGIIFVFTALEYEGNLERDTEEGHLEWIKFEDLPNVHQFDQNRYFMPYLFKDEIFEGKFLLNNKCMVLEHEIRKI